MVLGWLDALGVDGNIRRRVSNGVAKPDLASNDKRVVLVEVELTCALVGRPAVEAMDALVVVERTEEGV